MCGLFALISSSTSLTSTVYLKARSSLSKLMHRGPDCADFVHGDGWFIGHTRLSIVDLSEKANQPMTDITGRYTLAYNGELYNCPELRLELKTRGLQLRTSSDTEVLLHLLVSDGVEKTLAKIRGMFSFVFFDAFSRKLVCARDHIGQKPLHYVYRDGYFAFASEVTPLIDLLPRSEPDLISCRTYLCSGGIIAPDKTFFKDIHCLPAGHMITVESDKIAIREFFHITDLYDHDQFLEHKDSSKDDALDQLDSLIDLSIQRHLVSDVPIGILLSGGIDSSLLYSYASKHLGPLASYTKISPGIENIPATVVPKVVGHHRSHNRLVEQEPSKYLDGLIQFVQHTNTPSRWGGGPPMASVCSAAKLDGVKVLLGGDGVDECALGYSSHMKMIREFDGDLYSIHPPLALDNRIKFYDVEILSDYIDLRRDERSRALRCLSDIESDIERFAKAVAIHDGGSFLQSCTLPHSDAYSMMESIELRNPFLDLELLKFMVNLPLEKLCDLGKQEFGNKILFRDLAKTRIGAFTNVPKEGTRNYSMWISCSHYWDFSKFHINEYFPIPELLDKKQIFRILNLEIFWRHSFGNSINGESIYSALTHEGRKNLNLT